MAVLLSSNRDRVKLQEGGYLYVFDKLSSNGEKKFWRCERKSECNARIHTDSITNEIIKRTSEHNHPCSYDGLQSSILRAAIKRKAVTADDPFAIPNEQLINAERGVEEAKADHVRKLFHRAKNKVSTYPNCFASALSSAGALAEGGVGFDERCNVWNVNEAVDDSLSYSNSEILQQCDVTESSALMKVINVKNEIPTADESATIEPTASSALSAEPPSKRLCWKQSAAASGVEKYMAGGLIIWSPLISSIIEQTELIVNMVCQNGGRGFASLLLSGAANTGKSCLAALTVKGSDIAAVRVYGADDMLGLNESSKALALRKIFNDAHACTLSAIMLDSIDRLIDYCPVDDRYSNLVLQTLMILIKKTPPPNHRLLILATVDERCAREFCLDSLFTHAIDVPSLSAVDHLMAVIEDSNIFTVAQCEEIRQQLSGHSARYSIGIKKLLDILELVRHCEVSRRISFLCESMERMISL